MISDTSAVALTYGFDRKNLDCQSVLVIDLGSGTFDVTLLELSSAGIIEVLATRGDT